jgi:polysaccharide pyruvyl transferase WcaK-like protein
MFHKQNPATTASAQKIGLLQHVGHGNLGDDATVASVMHNIKSRWPHARIVGLTLNPSDTEKRHGIKSYAIRRDCKLPPVPSASERGSESTVLRLKAALRRYRVLNLVLRSVKAATIRAPRAFFQELPFLIESFRIVRSLDLLVVSGGGQLRDSWKGPWKFPYTLFKWVILAKLSGTRCYFINVGAGPLKARTSHFLIRHALRLADYISFRDERSRLLVRRAGFNGTSRIHADCVYGLPTPVRSIARNTLGIRESLIGISPMRVYWDENPPIYSHLIQQLGQFSAWLVRSQHRLELFGTDIWYDSSAVTDLHTAIMNEFPSPASPQITCPRIDGINALLIQMSSMDYVVTCRFHGVVFAHLLNIPILAISHHPKVHTMMSDIGLSDYCVDIRAVDLNVLKTIFTRLVDNREEIKARMAERAARFKRELTTEFDWLFPRQARGDVQQWELSQNRS